jgi:hypothetical protein
MLQRVELLPYHTAAGAKYEMVGMKYEPMFDVNKAAFISREIFLQYNIRSVVL